MNWVDMGLVGYGQALELQHRLVAGQKAGTEDDVLLLLQHPAVPYPRRRADAGNIIASPSRACAGGH